MILLVVLAIVAAACGGGGSSSTPTDPGSSTRNEIRTVASEPSTLDPHRVTDIGSHAFTGKLYSNLVKLELVLYDANDNQLAYGLSEITANQDFVRMIQRGEGRLEVIVVADLAESVPDPVTNSDGTVSYTFTIRENAKFFNGDPITAWDIAYSIERAADPATRSTTAEPYLGDILGVWEMNIGKSIINRVSPNQDEVWVDLPGLEVLDDRTIRITIDGPKEYFLQKLTYPTASVVSKFQVESAANSFEKPNSTGPYFIAHKDVSRIVLEANPNYHGDPPRISRITYFLAGGDVFLRFKNGELDFAGVGIADLDLLAEVRDPNSRLNQYYFAINEFSTSYIGFNNQAAPFDDPLVRRAFAHAIDKELLVELMEGLVNLAKGILPPGFHAYDFNFEGLEFNPEKARELLAQSQYAGNMPRIKFTIPGTGSAPSIIITNMVDQWKRNLGVEIEIEQMDFSTFMEQINRGTFQMFSSGWVADYYDAEDFLDIKFHSSRAGANNETRYSNPEVDALLEEARTESDVARRIELYREAERIIVRDAAWLSFFHGRTSVVYNSQLCGYFPAPMGISTVQYIYFCDR